jgi:hypothetical protein
MLPGSEWWVKNRLTKSLRYAYFINIEIKSVKKVVAESMWKRQ